MPSRLTSDFRAVYPRMKTPIVVDSNVFFGSLNEFLDTCYALSTRIFHTLNSIFEE